MGRITFDLCLQLSFDSGSSAHFIEGGIFTVYSSLIGNQPLPRAGFDLGGD